MLGEKSHAEDLIAAASDLHRRTRRPDCGSLGRVDLIEDQNKKRLNQLRARQRLFVLVAQAEEARVEFRNALMKSIAETETLLLGESTPAAAEAIALCLSAERLLRIHGTRNKATFELLAKTAPTVQSGRRSKKRIGPTGPKHPQTIDLR